MRRAARTDTNHSEIVRAVEGLGGVVTSLAAVGKGVPDLLVSYRGSWLLLEVKDGKRPPSARLLTDPQQDWIAKQRAPVHIVTCVDDAVRAVTGSR